MRAQLVDAGSSEDELDAIDDAAEAHVQRAVEFALTSPEPAVGELATGMHAAGSAAQFERMLPGSPFGEGELTFQGGLGE